jgi:hypothetical protein
MKQKAKELQNVIGEYYMSKDWGPHGYNNYEMHESVPFYTIEKAFIAGAEWMASAAQVGEAPQKMGIGKLRNLLNAYDGEEISISKFLEEINNHFLNPQTNA